MILYIDDLVIFIVFLLDIILLNSNFFISVNFGIATHSEAGYAAHQVEGCTEQEKPRDIVELVRDNNFDTLSEHERYIVLKIRFVPEANFDFPKTIKHGCNRSYKTYKPILPIPSSIVVEIMLSIVFIVCYLSPDTGATYWVHLLIVDTVNGIV